MNAHDVMMYGHKTLIQALKDFPETEWETKGVCGIWSAKDVISHLASYERILIDVLAGLLGHGEMSALKEFMEGGQALNDRLVDIRKGRTHQEVLAELNGYHAQALSIAERVPQDKLREVGTIPWYGPEYSVDDYIVYQYYGHKREHSAQIAAYMDRTAREGAAR